MYTLSFNIQIFLVALSQKSSSLVCPLFQNTSVYKPTSASTTRRTGLIGNSKTYGRPQIR